MKKSIKRWSIRLLSFGFVSLFTIVLSALNPSFLYANKTEIGNYTVLHNSELSPELEKRLKSVHANIQQSELFDKKLNLKICLNDGSLYPKLMEILRGPAFGWGFHNISTFRGKFNYRKNAVELNGYKWNLEQLITHELTHCLQFIELGLFKSNPLGNYPNWKWEGYAEYVARKNDTQLSLVGNIKRIESSKKENSDAWGIFFDDGTVSPRTYYHDWLLVQYCLDIKQMTYLELLNSEMTKVSIENEMYDWYLHALSRIN